MITASLAFSLAAIALAALAWANGKACQREIEQLLALRRKRAGQDLIE